MRTHHASIETTSLAIPVRQRIEFEMAVLVYIEGTERLVTTVPGG